MSSIDNLRAGVRPWAENVDLTDMVGYCDRPDGPVLLLMFRDSKPDDEDKMVGWWVWYGNQPDLPQHPDWAPMLSLDAAVIEYIVELLGPIEESAE